MCIARNELPPGGVYREVSPGMYEPATPYRPPIKSGPGVLARYALLLGVIILASVIREFWPGAPYLGVAVGLSYGIGRLAR